MNFCKRRFFSPFRSRALLHGFCMLVVGFRQTAIEQAAVGADALPRHESAITLPIAIVSLMNDVTVAAQETGQLAELTVREGMSVESGQLLGRLDDLEAQKVREIAAVQERIAEEKSTNDVDVRYAKAESDVKKFEYERARQANKSVADVIGQVEIKHMLLAYEEAVLKTEKAERDLSLLRLEKEIRVAEAAAAQLQLERRRVIAPAAGEIAETFADAGEWVKPGDPICRVVRLDQVWVEAFIDARAVLPVEVIDRPVTLTVSLTTDRREEFTGKVTFVDYHVDANGRFRIKADVKNRRLRSRWLLLPGYSGELSILPATSK